MAAADQTVEYQAANAKSRLSCKGIVSRTQVHRDNFMDMWQGKASLLHWAHVLQQLFAVTVEQQAANA